MNSNEYQKKLGQLIIPWMPAHIQGTIHATYMKKMITDLNIGGFIHFYGDQPTLQSQIQQLQSESETLLFICSDLERGCGQQVAGKSLLPDFLPIGKTGDTTFAYQAGRITGLESKEIGINFPLTPVLDIQFNPDNPIINIRSFGTSAYLVAKMGQAYIQGVKSAGILTCAKHFPGHGDTDKDSHKELPVVSKPASDLLSSDLIPFRRAIDEHVDAIMPAHIIYSGLDAHVPATLSKTILTGLLRDDLEFEGLVISDAMWMEGLSHLNTETELAIQMIEAGVNLILMPYNPFHLVDSLLEALRVGKLSAKRVDESLERIAYKKEQLKTQAKDVRSTDPIPDSSSISILPPLQLTQSIFQKSLHVEGQLPKPLDYSKSIFVLDSSATTRAMPLLQSSLGKNPLVFYASTSADQVTKVMQHHQIALPKETQKILFIYASPGGWKSGSLLDIIHALEPYPMDLVVLLGNPYISLPIHWKNRIYTYSEHEMAQMEVLKTLS